MFSWRNIPISLIDLGSWVQWPDYANDLIGRTLSTRARQACEFVRFMMRTPHLLPDKRKSLASLNAKRITMGIGASCFVLLAGFALYSNYLWARIVYEQPPASRYLREALTALIMYEVKYKTFPATLTALGQPQHGGTVNAEAADLIDSKLASGVYFGYVYRYVPTKSARTGKSDVFTIRADPAGFEFPGQLHYFTDETAVIRVESNRPATAVSHPIE